MTVNLTTTRTGLLAVGDAAALVAVHPAWHAVLSGVTAPQAWLAAGADAAVAEACGVLLWLAAVWLAIGLLAGLGARLPGAAGRLCTRCARVVVPRVLLRVVLGSTGLGLLAAPAAQAMTPAHAVTPGTAVRVAATSTWVHPPAASTWIGGVPSPSWPVDPGPSARPLPAPVPPTTTTPTSTPTSTPPTSTPPTSTPPTSTPSTSTPSPTPPSTPTTTPARPSGRQPHDATARVHAGDSLWLLAARRLGGHAGTGDIAQYWPQIYAANQAVLGGDPSVIHPGQVLHLPAPTTQESP